MGIQIKKLNIAIISTNKNKYSETFIHNHVKLIPETVHFLFDGYLPSKYSMDGGVTSYSLQDFSNKKWYDVLFKKSTNKSINLVIENYLIQNNIDLIFCEYGPSGVEMMPFSKKLMIPLIVHFHGYDAYRSDILNSYGKYYKELFNVASSIISVSKHMSQQLLKIGCPDQKIQCFPYGIDLSIFNLKNSIKKTLTFVACGRFVEKKAPQITIRAFEIVKHKSPAAKLIMIGDGELLDECIQLTNRLGIADSIEFKGKLSPKEIAEIYSTSLAFVQHSITTSQNDSEGTPLAILEACACGLPIISTIHTGISDIVIQNETGFLVDENDIDSMSEKMLLLAQTPQLALEMGLNASKYVSKNHNIINYTQRISNLITQCVRQ